MLRQTEHTQVLQSVHMHILINLFHHLICEHKTLVQIAPIGAVMIFFLTLFIFIKNCMIYIFTFTTAMTKESFIFLITSCPSYKWCSFKILTKGTKGCMYVTRHMGLIGPVYVNIRIVLYTSLKITLKYQYLYFNFNLLLTVV